MAAGNSKRLRKKNTKDDIQPSIAAVALSRGQQQEQQQQQQKKKTFYAGQQDLRGCPVEKLRDFPSETQQEIMNAYFHRLQSVKGRQRSKSDGVPPDLTDQRRNELFLRCIDSVKHKVAVTPQTADTRVANTLDTKMKYSGQSLEETCISALAQPGSKSEPTTGIDLTSYVSTSKRKSSFSNSSDTSLTTKDTTHITVILPRTKFQLQEEAVALYHSLSFSSQRREALDVCDAAALKVIQKGVPIHKPNDFFAQVLKKIVLECCEKEKEKDYAVRNNKDSKNSKATPTPKLEQPSTTQPNLQQVTIKTKDTITQAMSTSGADTSSSGQSPKHKSKSNHPTIRILKNENFVGHAACDVGKKNAERADNNSVASSTARQLSTVTFAPFPSESLNSNGQTIKRLQAQLDAKTKQSYQILKRNENLTKLWQAEKYNVQATKERNQLLENTVQRLQGEVNKKEHLLEAVQSDLTQQVQQTSQQEQQKQLETITAFIKLSEELCSTQQEKRYLQQQLDEEKAISNLKDQKIKQLQRDLERSEMLRPTPRKASNQNHELEALRRELDLTKERLARLSPNKSKSQNLPSVKAKSSTSSTPERLSLGDFAPREILQRIGSNDTGDHSTPKYTRAVTTSFNRSDIDTDLGCRVHSTTNEEVVSAAENARLVHDLLQEPTASACQQSQQPGPESTRTDIHFHGVDEAYDDVHRKSNRVDSFDNGSPDGDSDGNADSYELNIDNNALDVTTEIDFLVASFAESELLVETDPLRITRLLQLEFDRDSAIIEAHLMLTVPSGYPERDPLQVEASLAPSAGSAKNSSVEAQKVATDAMAALVTTCRLEAERTLGSNGMFSVLQLADAWVCGD